ncbi:MAG TPA: Fe-S cluster assembly scaffold SufA, partial [Alphaproteobacteria bacterium]|nr:Fe-S cluster assembly scaffold SufA [Alphaproteobacteria bacterium]
MFSSDKPIITLTDRATQHIQMLMDAGSSDVMGIRV